MVTGGRVAPWRPTAMRAVLYLSYLAQSRLRPFTSPQPNSTTPPPIRCYVMLDR